MQITRLSLLRQYRNDCDFRGAVNSFLFNTGLSLFTPILVFYIIFSVFAIVILFSMLGSRYCGFTPMFILQSAILGWVVGGSISLGLFNYYTLLPLFCRYTFIMAMFHFTEFFFTAVTNRRSLQPDSFLLNHSVAYWIAAVFSWIEFSLESFLFPSIKMSSISYIGFILCIFGEILRKTAMVHAGNGFTHKLALSKRPDHRLVTSGIYSYMRHPGYAGWLLWSVGTQLILCNPVCIAAYVYVSWNFFNERIYDEERDLVHFFGQQYIKYRRLVWVGIPFVEGFDITHRLNVD